MHADERQMAALGGVRDHAQTVAYLERNLKHWSDYGFGLWMLRDPATGLIMGRGMLRHLPLDGVDEVEVGYSLDPEYWGRGLATEIAATCLAFARDPLRLPSVVAITLPTNLASQRVMTKVGMVYERDHMHDGVPHVLFRTGTHQAG